MSIDHARIVGRDAELGAALDALVDPAHGAVVVVGEAGIGKSTLLAGVAAEAEARGFQVRRTCGAAAEVDLPFVGLHDLLADDVERRGSELTATFREALDVALLRAQPLRADGVDELALNLGVLALLTSLSTDGLLVIVLDDLQWIDEPTLAVLRFALRRTSRDAVKLLAAARPGSVDLTQLVPDQPWELPLGALDVGGLADLVERQTALRLSRPRAALLHELTGGNPLLALEMARANAADLTSVASLRDLSVPERHRKVLGARIGGLSEPARAALLAAGLLSRPTVAEVTRAAGVPGLVAAESAGLLTIGRGRIEFTHPLFAAVARQLASADERRSMHLCLAVEAEDEIERARHLGSATLVPDEATAAEIEKAAAGALERGAVATAADRLLQAASLTPLVDVDRRVDRLCSAARLLQRGGDNAGAARVVRPLLGELEPGPLRTECLLTLAAVDDEDTDGAIALLREALAQPGLDPAVGVEIQLDIVASRSNRFELAASLDAARALEDDAARQGRPDLMVRSRVEQAFVEFARGTLAADSRLGKAIAADAENLPVSYSHPHVMLACDALFRDDHDRAAALLTAMIERADAASDPWLRATLLAHLGQLQLRRGDLAAASATAEEALWVLATGRDDQFPLAWLAQVLATRGRIDEARQRAQQALAMARRCTDRILEAHCLMVLGFAAVSVGEYDEAVGPLDELSAMLLRAGWGNPNVFPWYADAIEAYLALDRVDDAVEVGRRISDDARRFGAPTALALAKRCRAMLLAHAGDLESAQRELEQALPIEEQFEVPLERARTLLTLGTVQRRLRQKAAARETLSRAEELFERSGAAAWAARARRELDRTVAAAAGMDLTAAERSVAELAASGATNREIAGQLFISEKTVESALTRAYRKLSVRSRTELVNHPALASRQGQP